MAELVLHEIGPSPNSMKARIALRYKGLAFDRKQVDPNDRAEIVRISGQPLTPVLVHAERVIFDSSAILRYLDGNFRKTPQLYSSDYQEMQAIEKWETHGRTQLMHPVGMVFGEFFSETKDPSKLHEASRLLHERTADIEARLTQGKWLVGDRMTAADRQDIAVGVQPLAVKAVMDGLTTMAFITTFGWGVILAVIPVVACQGTLTMLVTLLRPFLENHGLMDSIQATNGLLIFCVALIIFELKKIHLADYLPSLAIAPLLAWLWP